MTESLTYRLITRRTSLGGSTVCCYPRMTCSIVADKSTNKTYSSGLTGRFLPGVLAKSCRRYNVNVRRYLFNLDGIDLATVYSLNVDYGACAKIESILYSNHKIEDCVICILNGKCITE